MYKAPPPLVDIHRIKKLYLFGISHALLSGLISGVTLGTLIENEIDVSVFVFGAFQSLLYGLIFIPMIKLQKYSLADFIRLIKKFLIVDSLLFIGSTIFLVYNGATIYTSTLSMSGIWMFAFTTFYWFKIRYHILNIIQ